MLSYDSAVPNGQDQRAAAPLPSAAAKPIAATAAGGSTTKPRQRHHLWLVTGPAGCGKTTVAGHLADALDIPYIEGDQYHPQSNIDKMSSGIPLTDADRWDWLIELRKQANSRIHDGAEGVVVACSALKYKYRDVIRVAAYWDRSLTIHIIFLHASAELLLKRVTARKGHYMGANMVKSQIDILERPLEDEVDVITIDASRDVEEVKEDILQKVKAMLAAEE
ncbi:glucokinase [Metarhizium album ARSEF 1941]|uniref:Gluconokinase n=1 Tax=Metarhizium album (strain ARSEF 1941) TaxID=1081103 RepID=A0A0B2X0S0_METAS|nr:glucokinase [Metarhizium album ARSEF 1941]KHN99898.1 glucokinase [Metarhizium album ARSEF 1941]